MDLLVSTLLVWIEVHTEYQTKAIPNPAVQELTEQALTTELYSDVPHLLPAGGVDRRIHALYSYEDGPYGTIYILHPRLIQGSEAFENPKDNPAFQEILLHELIHHVQWHSGEVLKWQCQREGEKEAYLLGAQYLKQNNTRDPIVNRRFWANIYGRC